MGSLKSRSVRPIHLPCVAGHLGDDPLRSAANRISQQIAAAMKGGNGDAEDAGFSCFKQGPAWQFIQKLLNQLPEFY